MSTAPEHGRPDANHHRVDVRQVDGRWSVAILGPDGRELSTRACRDETEAWTYASTVRQHVYWLSDERFREYYRLGAAGSGSGSGG
jgi:hypothetical protein